MHTSAAASAAVSAHQTYQTSVNSWQRTMTAYSTESTITNSMSCIVFCHHLLLLPRTIICDPDGTIDSYLIMVAISLTVTLFIVY